MKKHVHIQEAAAEDSQLRRGVGLAPTGPTQYPSKPFLLREDEKDKAAARNPAKDA